MKIAIFDYPIFIDASTPANPANIHIHCRLNLILPDNRVSGLEFLLLIVRYGCIFIQTFVSVSENTCIM